MDTSLDREPALSARTSIACVLAVVVVALGAASFAPATVAHADAGDDLAQAQAAADEVAERWFEAQREAASIDAEIVRLGEQLTTLQSQARKTGATARARAVTLYRSASSAGSVGTLLEGGDVMDAARRNQLLERVNEESRAELDAYERLVQDTRANQSALEARKSEHAETLERLQADEVALQQQLARAQQAYQAEQAAVAAARQEALRSAAETGSDTGPATSDDTGSGSSDNSGGNSANNDEPEPIDPPPAPEPGEHPHHDDPFLACVRQRESRGIYTAVNSGGYYGAYQFAIGTWNATASHAGRPELIGVRPDRAAPWDQDDLAWVLYQWQGRDPWGGSCG